MKQQGQTDQSSNDKYSLTHQLGEKLNFEEKTIQKALSFGEQIENLPETNNKGADIKAGAALYLAGKRTGQPRTRYNIAKTIKEYRDNGYMVDQTSVKRQSRLNGNLRYTIKSMQEKLDLSFITCLAPDYMEKYRKELENRDEICFESAQRLLEELKTEPELSGRSQVALAGAALYKFNREEITVRKISEIANVNKNTVTSARQQLEKAVERKEMEIQTW